MRGRKEGMGNVVRVACGTTEACPDRYSPQIPDNLQLRGLSPFRREMNLLGMSKETSGGKRREERERE